MSLEQHWNKVYDSKDAQTVSWFQPRPSLSIELLGRVVAPGDAIVDVGAGASTLVDHLLAGGHTAVTLVDISRSALDVVRGRLGADPRVIFEVADVCAWPPPQRFDAWHDRAVFHFLVDEADRAAYRSTLLAALRPGGHAMVSTFHLTGPSVCSELPTARYDAESLVDALGGPEIFELVHEQIEHHPHPRGGTQAFQVVLLRRR